MSAKDFDVEMQPDGDLIQIVSKTTQHETYTTKYNVVWFDLVKTVDETTSKKAK